MEISNLNLTAGVVSGNYQINLAWTNPVTTFDKVRIVWNTTAAPATIDDGSFQEITDGASYWVHAGVTFNTYYYYSVFVYDGSSWGAPVSATCLAENAFAYGTALVVTVKDESEAPLVNHTVTVTRVRGASTMQTTPEVSDASGIVSFTPQADSPTDSVLWVGDEIVVLVESTPGTTLFETNIVLDGTMFAGYVNVVAMPTAAAPLYPATPTIPAGVNLTSTAMTRPYFIWTHTPDPDNSPSEGKVHYAIEMDTNADFTEPHSENYRLYKSVDDATPFEYSLESSSYETWLPFPSEGLVETGNARIRFTVPATAPALTETTWRWRVYSTDLTPAE